MYVLTLSIYHILIFLFVMLFFWWFFYYIGYTDKRHNIEYEPTDYICESIRLKHFPVCIEAERIVPNDDKNCITIYKDEILKEVGIKLEDLGSWEISSPNESSLYKIHKFKIYVIRK